MTIVNFDVMPRDGDQLLFCRFCSRSDLSLFLWDDGWFYRMLDGQLICDNCLASGADREEESQGDAD